LAGSEIDLNIFSENIENTEMMISFVFEKRFHPLKFPV